MTPSAASLRQMAGHRAPGLPGGGGERAFDDPGQRKAALSVALRGGFMALGVSIARPQHLNAHTDPFAFVISANIHRRHVPGGLDDTATVPGKTGVDQIAPACLEP